jgi:hypothetical protein
MIETSSELVTKNSLKEVMKMAKLEIRDLEQLDEVKANELAKIKGGALPDPMPRVLNQTRGSSLYRILRRKRNTFATPIEIP